MCVRRGLELNEHKGERGLSVVGQQAQFICLAGIPELKAESRIGDWSNATPDGNHQVEISSSSLSLWQRLINPSTNAQTRPWRETALGF